MQSVVTFEADSLKMIQDVIENLFVFEMMIISQPHEKTLATCTSLIQVYMDQHQYDYAIYISTSKFYTCYMDMSWFLACSSYFLYS